MLAFFLKHEQFFNILIKFHILNFFQKANNLEIPMYFKIFEHFPKKFEQYPKFWTIFGQANKLLSFLTIFEKCEYFWNLRTFLKMVNFVWKAQTIVKKHDFFKFHFFQRANSFWISEPFDEYFEHNFEICEFVTKTQKETKQKENPKKTGSGTF